MDERSQVNAGGQPPPLVVGETSPARPVPDIRWWSIHCDSSGMRIRPVREARVTSPTGPGSNRVAHFSDTYLPRRDGIITSVRTLVSAQRADGQAPIMVVPRHRGQPEEQAMLRLRAVPLGRADLRISPWLLVGAAGEGTLRELADHFHPRPATEPSGAPEQGGVDAVHVHTPGPVGLLGVLAARRLGLPLVQTYHTDLHAYVDAYRFPTPALRAVRRLYARRLDLPRPPLRALPGGPRHAALDACNTLLLGNADAVIVPSYAVLERVSLPVPDDRIFLVPTGVAPRPTTAAAVRAFRAQHGIAADDRVVLFVGRINREKGIDRLVRAFATVAADRPDVVLVLVGAVYEARWFGALVRSVSPAVAGRIVLAGEQPAEVVAAAYGAADVFGFASMTDTQALVLQEASLAGLPSVLADPVLHRHGPLGGHGVYAGADSEAFGQAILRLLADPGRAWAIGSAARAYAARHTPERYAEAVAEVYRHAAERAGRLNPRGRHCR